LVGAGFLAAGTQLNLSMLGSTFVMPLLFSPMIAVLLTMPLYKAAHAWTGRLGITKQSCVCVAPGEFRPVVAFSDVNAPTAIVDARYGGIRSISMTTGTAPDCIDKYDGTVLGITAQSLIDGMHYVSGAAVSFARGLNDTPKIVGLLLVFEALHVEVSALAVAAAMAIGGLLNSRRVAETMGKKISRMNDGQALTANLVTAFLVIFASRLGMPVSTTHVSVGSITGIGIVNGSADKSIVSGILLSWVLTLPVAAIIGAAVYVICPSPG
jgi:PiT family inorganic phosphate transporter